MGRQKAFSTILGWLKAGVEFTAVMVVTWWRLVIEWGSVVTCHRKYKYCIGQSMNYENFNLCLHEH